MRGMILVFAAVAATAVSTVGAAGESPFRKKFVELGWDIPDTSFLREHFRQMEEEGPFDGVVFRVEAKSGDGRAASTEAGWSRERWKKEWFRGAVGELKACHFAKFTDNFIRFNATPKSLEWTDDEGWNALEEKLGICAWVAREGGVKGLAPDFEPEDSRQARRDVRSPGVWQKPGRDASGHDHPLADG